MPNVCVAGMTYRQHSLVYTHRSYEQAESQGMHAALLTGTLHHWPNDVAYFRRQHSWSCHWAKAAHPGMGSWLPGICGKLRPRCWTGGCPRGRS